MTSIDSKPRLKALDCDILVLGAGVIGISIAIALLRKSPNLKVLILEKESSIGLHASGRNSGVIHAGFYYSSESLKAKFCVAGNDSLKKLCSDYSIPIRNCGKVVVTSSSEDEETLKTLYERGVANNVKIELLEKKFLNGLEPLANTYKNFVWSPSTSVTDPKLVIQALMKEAEKLGATVLFGQKVDIDLNGMKISSNSKPITYKHFVNAAGLQADRIAKKFGIGKEYILVPFMGIYRKYEGTDLQLSRLVYPVPNLLNPFLGVHFTLTLDGNVKIGPTAIPVLNREQYEIFGRWKIADLYQSSRGFLSVITGNYHDFPQILKSELPKILESRLVRNASILVPSTKASSSWVKMKPGIRAQLVEKDTGKLLNDFIVESNLISTHILNAVSPGWTSCLPFGEHVAKKVLSKL